MRSANSMFNARWLPSGLPKAATRSWVRMTASHELFFISLKMRTRFFGVKSGRGSLANATKKHYLRALKTYRDNGDSYIGNFEVFVKNMKGVESLNIIHEKIVKNYRLIPSSEIWTETTVDAYLKLLNYH
ncbi:MAG: hypothetical protein LBV74_00350, partial [Tannerella sp.]|nr:hypothetical protein [Tannerella sp.]